MNRTAQISLRPAQRLAFNHNQTLVRCNWKIITNHNQAIVQR